MKHRIQNALKSLTDERLKAYRDQCAPGSENESLCNEALAGDESARRSIACAIVVFEGRAARAKASTERNKTSN